MYQYILLDHAQQKHAKTSQPPSYLLETSLVVKEITPVVLIGLRKFLL